MLCSRARAAQPCPLRRTGQRSAALWTIVSLRGTNRWLLGRAMPRPWTRQEDVRLRLLLSEHGCNWSALCAAWHSRRLRRRSDTAVRQRGRALLAQAAAVGSSSSTRTDVTEHSRAQSTVQSRTQPTVAVPTVNEIQLASADTAQPSCRALRPAILPLAKATSRLLVARLSWHFRSSRAAFTTSDVS